MSSDKPESSRPDLLWAPWRIEYIENAGKYDGCILCDKPAESDDRANLILYRGDLSYVIMNRFPYNNGHLMIVPYRHTHEMHRLDDAERLELFALLEKSRAVLEQVMHPHGFNIGMNLGRVAGAGIDTHLHFHIVPRWSGDTNFMPILGKTKVISEALERTWEKLYKLFHSLNK